MAEYRLVGDIGGTNARFAIAVDGVVGEMAVLATDDHPTFEAAIRSYLGTQPDAGRLSEAAFAIAGPVEGDRIALTNHPWSFSIADLQARLGFRQISVVNDFTASALSLPYLAPSDVEKVGGGEPLSNRPIGIIGPGTGLGVSGLVPNGAGWIPLSGEGGHATMPAGSARESRLVDHLRERYEHVSAERLLSGQGLVEVYLGLAFLDGAPAADYTPAQVTEAGMAGRDPLCREALDTFCGLLGMVAGNLALTLGARGGVYIAGGIVPRLGPLFARSPFRARFEAKGRLSTYLTPIPTYVILHKALALVGLANLR